MTNSSFDTIHDTFEVLIPAGNQNIGFNQKIRLEGLVRDYDIEAKRDLPTLYNIKWTCLNINTGGPCMTSDSLLLNLDNQYYNILIIGKKTLLAYNGYKLTMTANS